MSAIQVLTRRNWHQRCCMYAN